MSLFDRFKKASPPAPDTKRGDADSPSADRPDQGGLFARFRQGLKKTSDLLRTDIRDLFKREGRLVDEEFLSELYAILIKTDMGTGPANEIRERVQARLPRSCGAHGGSAGHGAGCAPPADGSGRRSDRVCRHGTDGDHGRGCQWIGKNDVHCQAGPYVHCRWKTRGVGSGRYVSGRGCRAAHDLGSAHRRRNRHGQVGGDPASVAHRAVAQTLETQADICIIDTAGRLQTQVNLMQQLEKIRRVVSKLIPDAPHEVLLVLDATAGQNGISQAKGFSDAAGCTGIVLAKLDGTAKGGVVIPIRQQFQLPVKYIGLGEQPEDLALFDVERFVRALFTDQESDSR